MSHSLVERLRSRHIRLHADDWCLMRDAADEIERLARERDDLQRHHGIDGNAIGTLQLENVQLREALKHITGYIPGPVDDGHPAGVKANCYCAGCASIRWALRALAPASGLIPDSELTPCDCPPGAGNESEGNENT